MVTVKMNTQDYETILQHLDNVVDDATERCPKWVFAWMSDENGLMTDLHIFSMNNAPWYPGKPVIGENAHMYVMTDKDFMSCINPRLVFN